MGVLSRLWQVIRANLNSLVSQAEDPEKILEQVLMDMQEDLLQLRQAVAQAIATQKRTERQYVQARDTQEEWYRRAQLALQKGQEGLARDALTRRKSYLETSTATRLQLEQQTQIVDGLRRNMRQLEVKISEMKAKKDLYTARARSAKAAEKLNQALGNMSTNGVWTAFERMEDQVIQLEARSEASASLTSTEIERQFAALEAGGDVDAELAAMKARLLLRGQDTEIEHP
ncbi:MAG: PspA/IM30 family protein [Microcoleaceae cyanobacterium]